MDYMDNMIENNQSIGFPVGTHIYTAMLAAPIALPVIYCIACMYDILTICTGGKQKNLRIVKNNNYNIECVHTKQRPL